jgi:DNA-binding transcriptional MerR regulator
MTKLLHIGDVAKLAGVTPKTIRFYQRTGLLAEAARTESGYRLYNAADLIRLQQIRRLQSFGLSLKQIKDLLGEPQATQEHSLRAVLASLLQETEQEINRLEARRDRLQKLLAQEKLDEPVELPPSLVRAREKLGALADEISPEMLRQEAKMFDALDAYNWSPEYDAMHERMMQTLSENPDFFRQVLALETRLVALADLDPDDPAIGELVADFLQLETDHKELIQNLQGAKETGDATMSNIFIQVLQSAMSPAQQRFIQLMEQRQESL